MATKCQGWGNYLINVEGNGTIYTIIVRKHLDSNTKRLELLFCYNFINTITDEEEDMILVAELNLFTIGTITLLKPKIFTSVAVDAKTNIDAKFDINTDIDIDMKINIDEPIFIFHTH